MMRPLVLIAAAATLAGCSTMTGRHVVTVATKQQESALIDQMKSLAGTWEKSSEKGGTETIVFSVGSGGSAVREIMFPGSDHEMTNLYTMDGPTLLMTHYCAMGNQPHMRATAGETPGVIVFKFDGVSNMTSAEQMYMGELTITIKDKNTLTEEWHSFKEGQPAGISTFTFKRKA